MKHLETAAAAALLLIIFIFCLSRFVSTGSRSLPMTA